MPRHVNSTILKTFFFNDWNILGTKINWSIFVFQCFVFHLYKGVRAGGGIGDEIGEPDGDDYEVYRIMFDITFFFFVIVILLAIIQGKFEENFWIWTFVIFFFTFMILIDISFYLIRFDYRCVRWTSRSTWKRENEHGKQLFHLWFRKRIFRYGTTWFRYSCPTGAQSC